jgi:hypothetical protein
MNDAASLFSLAIALPERERVELAQRLIGSLETESPPVVSTPSLAEEIASRRARVQAGEYDVLDWRESIDEIRAKLSPKSEA